MALRGNLNDFSLPDVFQLVTFSRKTGVLRIKRSDGAEGSVWFRDGDVFFAQSNWHNEMLGERLVRAQRITQQALARALEIRASEGLDGRRLGAILIDEGYIGDTVLTAFVREQIQETIFDLMRWDEGEFDFEELPEIAEEDIGLSISIENVIMEGSRRLDEWGRIKKKIPSMDVVFKMATAPGEGTFEISLKPIEWSLLLLVDGTRSVADLALETDRTDFEVARIIYGLFSAGLLEFTADSEVERLRAEKRERDAVTANARAARRAAEEAARVAELHEAVSAQEAAEAIVAETDTAPEAGPAVGAVPTPTPLPALEPEPEPLFLGAQLPGPTAEDAAVLEEMMGAVLRAPERMEPEISTTDAGVEMAPPALAGPEEEERTLEAEETSASSLVVPGLDLRLLPVPSVEDMPPDLEVVGAPEQTLEQALSAVAEVATVGLDWGEPVAEPTPEPVAEPTPEVTPEPVAELTPELTPELLAEPVSEPIAEPTPEFAPEALIESLAPEPAAAQFPPEGAGEQMPESPVDSAWDLVPESAPPAETETPSADVSSYELELMSLGLGELPEDLFVEVRPADEVPEAVAPQSSEAAFTFDLDAPPLPVVPSQGVVGRDNDEPIDLGALLESLDRESDQPPTEESAAVAADVTAMQESGFDPDILREVTPPEPPGGVISTDAFMGEMSFEPIGLSGGMTDELSALTGANRPRPVVNVSGIPDRPAGVLTRDQSVDKDTLLRIIDGVKNL